MLLWRGRLGGSWKCGHRRVSALSGTAASSIRGDCAKLCVTATAMERSLHAEIAASQQAHHSARDGGQATQASALGAGGRRRRRGRAVCRRCHFSAIVWSRHGRGRQNVDAGSRRRLGLQWGRGIRVVEVAEELNLQERRGGKKGVILFPGERCKPHYEGTL